MTSDAGTRNALVENSLKRKVRVGMGKGCTFVSPSQVDQAIQLFERLEAKREDKGLPDIGVTQDSVIFTNAIADFGQCIMST